MKAKRKPTLLGRERSYRLGKVLENAELGLRDLATLMGTDPGTLSRQLRGLRQISREDITRLLVLGEAPNAVVNELVDMAGEDNNGRYMRLRGKRLETFVIHAQQASVVQEYAPWVLPWLLRTHDYNNAVYPPVFSNSVPDPAHDAHREALVALLPEPDAPQCGPRWKILLHEWALRIRWGTPGQRLDQVRHILALTARPAVQLRIMPMTTGVHAGLGGAFTLLEYARYPQAVYREDGTNGLFSDDHEDMITAAIQFSTQWWTALDENASRELLRRCLVNTVMPAEPIAS